MNWLKKKLEPWIQGLVTGRILLFHDALVYRGQIKPIPPAGPVSEGPPEQTSLKQGGNEND